MITPIVTEVRRGTAHGKLVSSPKPPVPARSLATASR
ncbi:MAG: hypothetical protein QOH62_819 [Solirubrobacteraceae bacterium]|jgi:hypothetical protein|nr:hypothetical protein [Solirubrobacteraceae bacterium]